MSKFYKMSYLKSAMKGTSSNILNSYPTVYGTDIWDSYPTTADSYNSAVTAILKRLGKKQIIA